MKYMILLYGSQQEYDALTGKQVPGKPTWGAEDFAAGLDLLAGLDGDERITGDHRFHTARGHLLEMAGERAAALRCYQAAARRATVAGAS